MLLGGAVLLIGQRSVAAQREPIRAGREELIGELGEVRARVDPVGQVFVGGALWRARSADPEEPLETGYRVRVESIDGLTLTVAPIAEGEPDQVAENVGTEPGGS